MQKFKKVKTFVFDKAQYRVSDSSGNLGLLQIDYANNSFEMIGEGLEKSATAEIESFAEDLLQRKHGKNFAGESSIKLKGSHENL